MKAHKKRTARGRILAAHKLQQLHRERGAEAAVIAFVRLDPSATEAFCLRAFLALAVPALQRAGYPGVDVDDPDMVMFAGARSFGRVHKRQPTSDETLTHLFELAWEELAGRFAATRSAEVPS